MNKSLKISATILVYFLCIASFKKRKRNNFYSYPIFVIGCSGTRGKINLTLTHLGEGLNYLYQIYIYFYFIFFFQINITKATIHNDNSDTQQIKKKI